MKTLFTVTALLSLAACDSGGIIDQTIRSGARESAVQACTAWIPQSNLAAAAGLSPERLCGCAADRVMEKNASQLAGLRPDSPEIRTALAQCIAANRTRLPQTEES